MAKVTVFNGVINGEKFDNVAAYNARMNELLSAGVEDISAASSTEIKNVEDETADFTSTCTCDVCNTKPINNIDEAFKNLMTAIEECDEELSLYPYMEEDEPFYLDIIVNDNMDIYEDTVKNAKRILDKCFGYIAEYLHDNDMCVCEKKDYLQDIKNIISDIKNDNQYNLDAISNIKSRRDALLAELNDLDAEEKVLRNAKPVIEMFLDFYRAVEAEACMVIAENKAKNKCKCDDLNKNKDVTTNVVEKYPQAEIDLKSLFDKIFNHNNKLF